VGRRRLIKEALEDAPRDPHGALIGAENDAEIDGIPVGIPTSVFWKLEKQHCGLQGMKAVYVRQLFYHIGV
jgi:hypothetical protein